MRKNKHDSKIVQYPLTHKQYQRALKYLREIKSSEYDNKDGDGTEFHLGEEGLEGRVFFYRRMTMRDLDKETKEALLKIIKGKTE